MQFSKVPELSFTSLVEKLCKKLSQRIGVLKKIRSCLPTKQRLLYYNTVIRSVLHYVSSIWTSCDKENLSCVFKLQKRAARVISEANNQAPVVQTLDSSIQRISIRKTNCVIHWIDFYPVDNAIQRLNNRGLASSVKLFP